MTNGKISIHSEILNSNKYAIKCETLEQMATLIKFVCDNDNDCYLSSEEQNSEALEFWSSYETNSVLYMNQKHRHLMYGSIGGYHDNQEHNYTLISFEEVINYTSPKYKLDLEVINDPLNTVQPTFTNWINELSLGVKECSSNNLIFNIVFVENESVIATPCNSLANPEFSSMTLPRNYFKRFKEII